MIVVVEVDAAIDAAGTVQKFLFGEEGWTTRPTDTPANTWVMPRLIQAANYRRELFSGSRTFGPVRPAFGECKLANPDGQLDEFARYGFDGRAYTIRVGPRGADYPEGFITVLTATMKCALFELSESLGAVRLLLRDQLVGLDKPLASAVFAATGGVEGTAISAQGARKPLAFGTSFSIAPRLIDENNLIYHVGLPPAGFGTFVLRVQDGGENIVPYPAAFTEQADYAALLALPVPAGSYGRCSALGLVKLGLKPTFQLTCSATVTDVVTHTDATASLLGNILKHMALAAGVAPGAINAADVAAVNAARTGSYGYWVGDEETALSAMSKIANSASVWTCFDALGVLRMGVFSAPSGTPAFSFTHNNVTKLQRLDSEESSVPIWKVTARSSFTRAPQANFAASVPAWYAQWYDREWPLETPATTPSILTKHPGAGEMMVDVYTGTYGVRAGDAGEAGRRLALYGVARDTVQVTAPLTQELLESLDLGEVAELRYPRFGWDAGKPMCTVAIAVNLDAMRADITLWG